MAVALETPPCDHGVVHSAPQSKGSTPDAKPWVLAATILGSSLAFINQSVVNVALPAIQSGLNASATEMQWVVNAYMLFLGALILAGGSAGDIWGRRRIFGWGIVIFTLASVGCGLARDTTQLVLARGVQGIGGALLVPSSLAIISASFPKEERGKAIGTWSGFSAITTAGSPILGGWLVDAVSWRWVFFVVVPIALATLALTVWKVPESTAQGDARGLDWWGALLATLGLGALTYGLIAASERGFGDPLVLGGLIGGVLGLGLFLWVEARRRSPMMPLGLWKSRTFSGANLLTLLLYFALGGLLFFLPFNLIQVQGYSATLTGAAFLPFALIMGVLSRWSGGLIDRWGAKKPLIAGPLVAAVGFALFALPGIGGSYWTTFFPPMAVLGLGMALSVAPLTTTVMSAVDEQRAGVASGVNNAVSRVAGVLAVAALGLIAIQLFSGALDDRVAALDLAPAVERTVEARSENLANLEIPAEASPSMQQAIERAVDESFVHAFRWIAWIAAGLATLSALCAWAMIEDREIEPSAEAG